MPFKQITQLSSRFWGILGQNRILSPVMGITQAAIAAAGTSLILGTANPIPLGLGILGSQLPDIDTTTSVIGQIFFPVSNWIENRFPIGR